MEMFIQQELPANTLYLPIELNLGSEEGFEQISEVNDSLMLVVVDLGQDHVGHRVRPRRHLVRIHHLVEGGGGLPLPNQVCSTVVVQWNLR